ncbi:uncharacterized protein LOC110064335 isoform X2 [Orbicella faveolata]|uniref:uncharacterized protein LOC110064335 isoform X2 n=1 Tax=Orbicella faveolata TaxID=48498 RepID=UPI0009E5D710|nr:uncharacterized protein LOC110064335 isoform X2 [Orbicella faveolata]
MQSVSNEIADRQDRSDTLNNNVDRKRSQLSQLQRQLSELESNVHDLKSHKLRLKAQLQTRTHLEQQKAELTANNSAFTREIKEAETELTPIAVSRDFHFLLAAFSLDILFSFVTFC